MTELDIAAILVVLAAVFATINHHVLKLPTTIGLVIIALAASLAAMAIDVLVPSLALAETIRTRVAEIDFYETVMDGLLGFLLFAGALHVDFGALRNQRWVIAAMATLGVLLSTAVVGVGFYWITGIPLIAALVFGALISPTDPVAVLGILKTVTCLLYTSPSPRDRTRSRMPSSA